MLLSFDNPELSESEKTYLSDPVGVGTTNLSVKNSANFATNDYVVIGMLGHELTEVKRISAVPSVSSLTSVATEYSHSSDDPIYKTYFNQIRIYRATSSGGSYTLLATVSINFANPRGVTVYDDTTGSSSYYYKIDYYNDVSTLSSSLSDILPGTGYGRLVAGKIIDEVQEDVHDRDEQISTRPQFLNDINDCNDYVYQFRKKWRHWKTSGTLTATADTETVSLSSLTDLDDFDYLEYNYVSGSTDITYRLREISVIEMDGKNQDANATHDDRLKTFAIDDTADNLRLNPIPDTTQTSKLTLHYYKTPNTVDSEGDTLEIPDRLVYKNYLKWQHFLRKEDHKMADKFERQTNLNILNLVRRQKKQSTQGRSLEYRRGGTRGRYKY